MDRIIVYAPFLYHLISVSKGRHKNKVNNKESVIYSYKRRLGILFIFSLFVDGEVTEKHINKRIVI